MTLSSTNASPRSRAIFFLPMAYFVSTRLEGRAAVASWVMIYPVPLLISVWTVSGHRVDPAGLVALLLAMLATYTLYELGYMDNDTRTVRRESAPTERLRDDEKAFYERARWFIVTLRLVIAFGACFAITALVPANAGGKLIFSLGLLGILTVFPAYNSVRGRVNLPLHFVLVLCRFCLPGMVLVSSDHWTYFGLMIVAFPLINLMERAGEPRYGLPVFGPVLKYRHWSRVIYYLVATAIALVILSASGSSITAAVTLGYFFVYRLLSPFILRS